MMNVVVLIGRLTKAVELRLTAESQMAVGRTSIAVDRKDKKGEADFINLVAFGKIAEAMEKYTDKGSRVAIRGHIQTGSYTNREGAKVYTTDVIVDDARFIDFKSQEEKTAPQTDADGFMNIPAGIDEELPFR